MSRSSHQRQQQKLQQQQQQLLAQQQKMAENESTADPAELFDYFCVAPTMRQVLGTHREMCAQIGLRPAPMNEFYPKLKAKIHSWKAQALWKKFDARAAHRAYARGTAATGTRVLVIGAGPCGLRTAIEAQLLGAKVVVVEKRDRISRNNVLHLWPFVITDLRNLGAKKFYGKFCAGSIDHISIRQIQCILLKVALLLGVEVHEGVSFNGTIEPNGDGCGWRAAVSPEDHAVSHYEFDVLIGADGKRNTLEGFKRKEFRGKLAIAITANFINKKTEAEAKAEEISGVAFIFNQSFFKELYHTTGIDLENIVYYKDETHYFVMTAKKHSLIDKGVIMQDFADPAELLAPANVNTEKLLDYAREAAEFSTKYQMPNLEFAVNHYGKPDVAMFDFTSMFAAEISCRAVIRKGFKLLQCLVGDSLLEPFWPTGSGCARGFLSSMDAAYAIKLWANPHNSTLGVLAQRESIYRLLNQTTPENLQRDIGSYTVDPATRYPNLNRTSVNVWQVKHLIDTDDKAILEQTFMDTNALQATPADTPVRRKRRSGDSLPLSTVLLRWICAQLHSYEFTRSLKEVSDVFTHGKVLCALINRYRPDLVDFNAIQDLSSVECNDIAFRVLEKELNIPRIMTGKDAQKLNNIESKIWLNYLEQICEVFRGEIPHVKHPKMDFSELRDKRRHNIQPDFSKLLQLSTKHKVASTVHDMVDNTPVEFMSTNAEPSRSAVRKHATRDTAKVADQQGHTDTPRRAKKRRSAEKAINIEERQKRLQEIEQNRQDRQSKRRQQRYQQTQNFYKSLHMLQANTLLRESDEATAFEDYSIFMYRQQAPEFNDRVKELERKLLFPDRERNDIPSALPRNATDEQFSDRIKSMEQRITSRNTYGTEKKPKDLMRAIGKIDSNDWNVREIEKKIEQSKKTEIHGPKGREKVPKWSKEQFMARQNKMSKPMRQDSGEEKFKEIDQTLKNLDKQLKEGSVLEIGERGRNKVASIAGQFVKKDDTSEEKNPPTVVQKSSSKVALAFKKQAASEKCHFCKQTVYLMEKITTEGLILHRSCLKCYHCHTNLRPGGYAFDRDDPNGHFYCTQHFRLPAKAIRPVVRKPGQRKPTQQQQAAAAAAAIANLKQDDENNAGVEPKTPDKLRGHADSVAQLDLLDRGQTPERIEFENTDAMSDGEPSEEHIIDENEWSGRNFLPESNNNSESDLSSSEESGSESDSDIFEEANDSPLGVQTLQLATDWIGKQNYSDSDDSDDFYDSSDGIPDDGKDDTEGEEFKKARELRREEVRLLPLPPNLPTDTETELKLSANENKENIEIEIKPEFEEAENKTKNEFDKQSELSFNSERSLLSSNLSLKGEPSDGRRRSSTTKTDMEKIEQNSDRKLTAEVDEISEKLYRLNNMVKLNKDLENLAKENLVQSDIKKKLSLKEQWLASNNVSGSNADDVKSKFDEKLGKLLGKSKSNAKVKENVDVLQDAEAKVPLKSWNNNTKETNSASNSPYVGRKAITIASRSDSFKSTSSMSPKLTPKSVNVSPTNSLKKSATAISGENKMHLENILDIVKNIDISGSKSKDPPESPDSDIGKLLYDIEIKSTEKSKRGMAEKLKEIESNTFAGTMDSIKSQITMPTVSSQAAPSVDLSKYFPNQKQEKSNAGAINKNQKNLKDVDLTKYFPSSPVPQKRTTLTVAEKLKKAQNEAIPSEAMQSNKISKVPIATNKEEPKSQPILDSATVSLREHQLDGAIDLTKRKSPVVKTSTATATMTKKGNIKIIKKIVPKGTKAKKAAEAESERILDEILHIDDEDEIRSPSMEYKHLFEEEKSPSEDISDKIESLFEETGINLDLPKKQTRDRTKTLQKAKSLGESEFERSRGKLLDKSSNSSLSAKEDSDEPAKVKGVKNILQRFESLSSFKSQEKPFKLQRMESSTSNLNKSRESLVSRESDSLSDLDKTMEYLKTEWRNEATNFLQKKRDKFYAHKRAIDDTAATNKEEQKKSRANELPVQYRESKIAKFFGFKQKSPEKRKSPVQKKAQIKTKVVEKKKSPEKTPLKPKTSSINSENKAEFGRKKIADTPKITEEEAFILSLPTSSKESIEKAARSSESVRKPPELARTDEVMDGIVEKVPKPSEIITQLEKKQGIKQTLQQKATNISREIVPANDTEKPNVNNDLQRSKNACFSELKMSEMKANVAEESLSNSPAVIEKPAQITSNTPPENRRPLVEDIKNLPKFGCDKSQNNSRRGSQSSLQSRRQSDSSLTEQLEKAAFELSKTNTTEGQTSVENIFQEIVQQLDNRRVSLKDLATNTNGSVEKKELSRSFSKDDNSLSFSQSNSLHQTAVQVRGSSEEESIEKLFCQFSDDMLVDVEFDSNDELIAIAPCAVTGDVVETEANRDYIGKLDSLEKDYEVVKENVAKLGDSPNHLYGEQTIDSHELNNDLNDLRQSPVRPQRRQKSASSSSEPSVPIAPQRFKKKLAGLDANDKSPSEQDISIDEAESAKMHLNESSPLKYSRKILENANFASIILKEDETPEEKKNLMEKKEKEYDRNNSFRKNSRELAALDISLNTFNNVSVNSKKDDIESKVETKRESSPTANKLSNTTPPSNRKIQNKAETDSLNEISYSITATPENVELDKHNNEDGYSKISSQLKAEKYFEHGDKNMSFTEHTEISSTNSKNKTSVSTVKVNSEIEEKYPTPNIYITSSNINIKPIKKERKIYSAAEKTENSNSKIISQKEMETEKRQPSEDSMGYRNTNSKEKSLDWDMEKIPPSPMPRRKFVHAERRSYQDANNMTGQSSNASSTKSLNKTEKLQASSGDNISEEELLEIEKFAQERRQSLIKRDREYEEYQKIIEAANLARRNSIVSTDSDGSNVHTTKSNRSQIYDIQDSKNEEKLRQALIKRDRDYEKHQNILAERRASITSAKENDTEGTFTERVTRTTSALTTNASDMTSTHSKETSQAPQESVSLVEKKERGELNKVFAEEEIKTQKSKAENEPIPSLNADPNLEEFDKPIVKETEGNGDNKASFRTLTAKENLSSLDNRQNVIFSQNLEEQLPKDLMNRDKDLTENKRPEVFVVPKTYNNSEENDSIVPSKELTSTKPNLNNVEINEIEKAHRPTSKLENKLEQVSTKLNKTNIEKQVNHADELNDERSQGAIILDNASNEKQEENPAATVSKLPNTVEKENVDHMKTVPFSSSGVPIYIPDSDDENESIPEVFKNRVWPKIDDEVRSKSVEHDDDMEDFIRRMRKGLSVPRSESPLGNNFENRPLSESQQKYRRRDNAGLYSLKTNSSPNNSLKRVQLSSSPCSIDTDVNSYISSRSTDPIASAPQRHKILSSTVDSGTKLLLDRGKDLHDRKRDFMNERVAERNSYNKARLMKTTSFDDDSDDDDNDINLDSYRPINHTSSISRKYPSSRSTPIGSSSSRNIDYVSTAPTSLYPGLRSSGVSKRLYTPTVPATPAIASHSYLRYPSHSTSYTSPPIPTRSHFTDYFKRSPSNYRDRSGEVAKESCVQTDSESSSSKVEQNSATEISTDSEFDQDEIIRETPKIFIDDSHLRKPTKVQIKSSIILPSMGQKYHTASSAANQAKGGSYLQKYQTNQQPIQPQFKPLVQVDPSVLNANRIPLQNPRPGDYLLNKTASTEGIASKKSLELKKRYLLGEPANGSKIQKSGSTSVLDSKIRSFHSNISECQKLLNPSNDISASMKNFLDRTKLGEQHSGNDVSNILRQSATGNILNDLKVEITIQKASSAASTDNEKENLFVNSKNELNKGMEYSETVNTTLVESMSNKSPTTPTNNQTIIETIDLVTPEKKTPIVDLTKVDIPTKMLESNVEFINNITVANGKELIDKSYPQLLHTDSNKIFDAISESPVKSDTTVIEDVKPDVSKDVKECMPDIIEHIESSEVTKIGNRSNDRGIEEEQLLLSNSYDEEKKDSPEKNSAHDYENNDLQIEVPNIPWSTRKEESCSSSGSSHCSSNTSSIEDIQHYILESTTSPDTAPNGHQVPRVEVRDTAGELMQIDSLVIIDGRFVADPDHKLTETPDDIAIPEVASIKTSEIDDEPDIEPVTATPEPADHTVIEAEISELPPLPENGPPLPERGPPKIKPFDLKFDTKNENKVESLKNLPLIVEQSAETSHAMKPLTLNIKSMHQSPNTPTTPRAQNANKLLSPLEDNDKTPTAELYSRGSDSETEHTGTGQVFTETELSDWTADDCISENFVDIEFVLNSSKGTIKRNKNGAKKKKTLNSYKELPSATDKATVLNTQAIKAPVAEFEGILGNLDIDEIEFMDTGSEGSCAEAYSATNTAMLRNRGYMEYIETAAKTKTTSHNINKECGPSELTNKAKNSTNYQPVPTKRDEVLGIDYIEQGAYILQRGNSHNDMLKTPVNELPSQSITPTNIEKPHFTQLPTSALTQSLTDSSTLNDLDDDSLVIGMTQSATNTKTTTDESEALTIVTSPLDSSSPKVVDEKGSAKGSSTPSSSDKNPKTSTISTGSPASSSNGTSSRQDMQARATSAGSSMLPSTTSNTTRQGSDDLSYEEYVRALQQKITQISNARDSLDTRKQRRKSSKGETPMTNISSDSQTVIEKTRIANGSDQSEKQSQIQPSLTVPSTVPVGSTFVAPTMDAAATQVHKVPEIPTLTRRLEEITKERTKQKDLIHDLVMDKLQSKKQLNAEKRLHRSRQRTMLASGGCGYTSGSSLSPTPKIPAAATTTDTNCTSQAHYHVSTSAAKIPIERQILNERSSSSSLKENNPLQKSATYVSAYRTDAMVSPTKTSLAYRSRPLSEHRSIDQVDPPLQHYKLAKTPSCVYPMSTTKSNLNSQQPVKEEKSQISKSVFNAPMVPLRYNRGRSGSTTDERVLSLHEENAVLAASTEKLRTEARARARLKSNNELGLSPEEKMQILRKRLHLDDGMAATATSNPVTMHTKVTNKPLGPREHKMSSSKSVNDLASVTSHYGCLLKNHRADEHTNNTQSSAIADFTSDPNLLLSSTSKEIAEKSLKDTKSNRRAKDPERRKSIIQSLSSFFHMGSSSSASASASAANAANKKDSTNASSTAIAGNSAQPERPGTSGSHATTTSSNADGVFSRFRIASKPREKSKSCLDVSSFGFGDKDGGHIEASLRSQAAKKTQYERSSSQDCILSTRTKNNSNTIQNNLNHHHHDKHLRSPSTTSSSVTAKYSASSPQLYVVAKNNVATTHVDDQIPPPIPPLPLNYQRSDDESCANETREQKKQRSISKAVRQAELKRLRIAQEIQREQEEIEVQLKELEARGVLIEKALRGEGQQHVESLETSNMIGASDEKLLKELLEIWRNITQLKKRDDELGIRQQELQLEHRHAQLKEELNVRLSSSKLDKSSADVAAEAAILNEMLEIVAKRAALRPNASNMEAHDSTQSAAQPNAKIELQTNSVTTRTDSIQLNAMCDQVLENNESQI